jgi:hypothetical protein
VALHLLGGEQNVITLKTARPSGKGRLETGYSVEKVKKVG